jgi:carbonic anhydrase
MEESYLELLKNNRDWVEAKKVNDPEYFDRMADGQSPRFLWIGCADSRVPANTITGTSPGDMFVHRNIANMVVHTDISMLSVLQYAVDVLKVEHVIVCGHYGCGGVNVALSNKSYGLIDNWLRNIKDVYRLHQDELDKLSGEALSNRMVELNVEEQVYNLCKTSTIQEAWDRGQNLHVHGWVYSLEDGLIHDLNVTIRDNDELGKIYQFEENVH